MTGNANINRDGGVIRSNMKWISNKVPYGLKYHNSGGTVVDCTDANGCTNPEAEINTDGSFVSNPEAVTGGNSGVINYINKFGYANGYKTYDPISEMYYEIVRYFKNLGPSTDTYCSGLTSATDDGFKLFCGTYNGQNWRDPYLYTCQNSVVLAINDANPWCDKRVPGTPWVAPTGGPSCTNDGGAPSNANTFTDATTGTAINTETWTNKVGNYEFGSSITFNVGCVLGGTCDWSNTSKTFTDLGRVSGTAPYAAKQNSYYIAGLSYYAHTNDLRSDLTGTQTLTTYMIDTQESNATMLVGRKSMLFLAAKYGGFTNVNGTNANGDMVPDQTVEWDKDGDGFPDNYLLASSDPSTMEQGFARFFLDIMNRASSGTAASVLASSEGSGANILQALFYPKRPFGTQEISWTGEMQNLWYYVDPYLQNANIREDSDSDKTLNLINDNVIQFYFDSTDNQVKVRKYSDSDGNGSPDNFVGVSQLEDIKNLWEVGTLMWSRDLGSSPRTIYTTVNGTSFLSGNFSTSNASTLAPYMLASADTTETTKIISYIHGADQTGYRSRNVTIASTSNVWKLGDIINSTPRTQSSNPLNSYHLQPPNGYLDTTYYEYINQTAYRNRGMAYVGGNDGMLHAFKTGKLVQLQSAADKARLDNPDASTPLGSEVWAFIPKNTLPYLQYLADPNYCHLFYVDAPVYLVDASVQGSTTDTKTASSWKTILIGSSGMGGACRNASASCTDCVKTPITDVGYSSYFALDVTDPNNPVLLWEFSDPTLGFSTSGPAVVRVGESYKNGQWFVVLASGPTGPIDTTYHQYLGKSDQNLKLFILDLKTGALLRDIDTGIAYAFGGSLYNATLDTERGAPQTLGHYNDDVLYLGYTKKDSTSGTWTDGGVLRILTKEDADPGQWAVSMVIDNVGPVTSSVAKLQDRKRGHLWLYFGSGRFYYKMGSDIDDPDGQRAIYGLKDPCYSVLNDMDNTCSDTLSISDLQPQTTSPTSLLPATKSGWYIDLDSSSVLPGYKAERVITDPLAAFNGVVFFTTFAPNGDACALGGNTYIWALNYSSGSQATNLAGKAILQVSTGEIKEFNLGTAFTGKDGRRTAAISGVPPKGQGLSVLIGPRPLQKVLHIQEK